MGTTIDLIATYFLIMTLIAILIMTFFLITVSFLFAAIVLIVIQVVVFTQRHPRGFPVDFTPLLGFRPAMLQNTTDNELRAFCLLCPMSIGQTFVPTVIRSTTPQAKLACPARGATNVRGHGNKSCCDVGWLGSCKCTWCECLFACLNLCVLNTDR